MHIFNVEVSTKRKNKQKNRKERKNLHIMQRNESYKKILA